MYAIWGVWSSWVSGVCRATAKSRKTGRAVPANPEPIGGLKNKLNADGRGSGRKSAYFQRSSALLSLFRVYPADRSPTAQFGQDCDFAVTLGGPEAVDATRYVYPISL